MWPLTPIQGNVRLGISAISYRERLNRAIHADASMLHADVLGEVLRDELERIEQYGSAHEAGMQGSD